MKKICFVAEYMLCGGTEKSLLSLLPLLDRNKYDITLLLLKKKGDLIAELPEDIKVQEIPLPKEIEDELLYGRKKSSNTDIEERKNHTSIQKNYRRIKDVDEYKI